MKKSIQTFFADQAPFFWVIPAYMWQILFFYIPIFFMVYVSFLYIPDGGKTIYYSFAHYASFFKAAYFLSIVRSFFLASLTSILCLFLGYPLAYFLSFIVKKTKNIFLFLFILPFWTNFLLHIYAWFFVLERGGFLNSFLIKIGIITEPIAFLNSSFAVVLVMVYCYLPFMTLPIYSVLEKFDKRLIEASEDLGATSFQTFRYIVLPLVMPGIRSGLFLVFVPAFGDFAIPTLLGGDTYMYVGTIIAHYIMGIQTMSRGAAFTVSISIVLLCIVMFYSFFLKRRNTMRIQKNAR